MTESTPPKASICPLCGNDNQCAMAAGRPAESCWCWEATIDPAAREKAGDTATGQCLCPACGLPAGNVKNAG